MADGYRESEQSWKELAVGREVARPDDRSEAGDGDGALGFWKALPQVYPRTREQRCWVHKTANVLDKMPKRLQAEAKEKLHAIWMAADAEADADKAFDLFVATYQAKYPKAPSACGRTATCC